MEFDDLNVNWYSYVGLSICSLDSCSCELSGHGAPINLKSGYEVKSSNIFLWRQSCIFLEFKFLVVILFNKIVVHLSGPHIYKRCVFFNN